MPTVRLTYPKDIRREGSALVVVSEDRARVLVNERRGVVVEDLPELPPVADAPEGVAPAPDLSGLTKKQLLGVADELGVQVDGRLKKADIITAIQGAEPA
jgi:hypothetical protein